jgi:hypothetical protein
LGCKTQFCPLQQDKLITNLSWQLVDFKLLCPHPYFAPLWSDKQITNLSWLPVSIKLILWQPTYLLHPAAEFRTTYTNSLLSTAPIRAHTPILPPLARQADCKPFPPAGGHQINFVAAHTSPPHCCRIQYKLYKHDQYILIGWQDSISPTSARQAEYKPFPPSDGPQIDFVAFYTPHPPDYISVGYERKYSISSKSFEIHLGT